MIQKLRSHQTFFVVGLFIVAVLFAAARQLSAQAPSATQQLADAQAKIAKISGYEFTSHTIEFTEANSRNVASTAAEKHLHLEGATNRQAETFSLKLWDTAEVNYAAEQAMQLKLEDGAVFGRTQSTDWEQLNDMETFASSADGLIFLAAAHHADFINDNTQQIRFLIDGQALNLLMREQLRDQLVASGQLPKGIALDDANIYANTIAKGELILDGNGLPAQLYVSLEWPSDGTTLLLQSNYSNYDTAGLIPSISVDPIGNITASVQSMVQLIEWKYVTIVSASLLVLIVALWLSTRLKQRYTYPVFALFMSIWMAVTPLESFARAAYADDERDRYPLLQQAAEEQELEFVQIRNGQTAGAELRSRHAAQNSNSVPLIAPLEESFDTTRSPLDVAQEQSNVRKAVGYILSGGAGGGAAASSGRAVTGIDNDKDGLMSTTEAIWGTSDFDADSDNDGLTDFAEVERCPDASIGFTGVNQQDTDCSNPTDLDGDTDNDGLSDAIEIRELGTAVNNPDTDYDQLLDAVEVAGWEVSPGVRRYSNPIHSDTDGDGLLDGDECPELQGTPAASAACGNSNSADDNIPDIFDHDNDGDGVFNPVDASPYSKLPASGSFGPGNPFELTVNNVDSSARMLVDVQISPTESRHLGYASQTIDWPSGDTTGQVQRRLDTTFPGVSGDVRAIPMLEMSFAPGSDVPLPRTSAVLENMPLRAFSVLGRVTLIDQPNSTNVAQGVVSGDHVEVVVPSIASSADGEFVVEIYEARCSTYSSLQPEQRVTGLTFNAPSADISGVRLSTFASGEHVMVLQKVGEPAANAECVAIERLAEGGSQLNQIFVRESAELGTATFSQTNPNLIDVAFNWTDAGDDLPVTLKISEGSCISRGSTQLESQVLTAGQATTQITNRSLVSFANGRHIMTLERGGNEVDCLTLPNLINGAEPDASQGIQGETDMIDMAVLSQYGMAVSESDTAGTLVVSSPMIALTDDLSGRRSGFSGQLLFDAQQGTTLTGDMQMVWWIIALNDFCIDPPSTFMPLADEVTRLTAFCGEENLNQQRVVHKYDEEWILGSVTVREDYGVDVAVIHENPDAGFDVDLNSDDNLWQLANFLDETFVEGVDCSTGNVVTASGCTGANNEVDLQVDELGSVLGNWGFAPNIFKVTNHSFATELDLGNLPKVIIPNVLDSQFVNSGTGEAIAEAPVLLVARSETQRAVSLDMSGYVTPTTEANTDNITLDFAPANEHPILPGTLHSLSWRPYQHQQEDGQFSWHAYDSVAYLNLLENRLVTSDSGEVNSLLLEAEAGRLAMAKSYFAYLLNGRTRQVSVQNGATEIPLYSLNDGVEFTATAAQFASRLATARGDNNILAADDSGELIIDVVDEIAKGYALLLEAKLRKSTSQKDREAFNTELSVNVANISGEFETMLIQEVYVILGRMTLSADAALPDTASGSSRGGGDDAPIYGDLGRLQDPELVRAYFDNTGGPLGATYGDAQPLTAGYQRLPDSAFKPQLPEPTNYFGIPERPLDVSVLPGPGPNPVGSNEYAAFPREFTSSHTNQYGPAPDLPPGDIYGKLDIKKSYNYKGAARLVSPALTVVTSAMSVLASEGLLTERQTNISNAVLGSTITGVATYAVVDAVRLKRSTSGLTRASVASAAQIGTKVKVLVGALEILEIAVIWGMFAYQVGSEGMEWGGLELNRALGDAFAATSIAILFIALAATGPVGAIIAAVIGLLDAAIAAACAIRRAVSDEDSEELPYGIGEAICQGISAWLSKAVAYLIYDNYDMVTIDDPYRLNITRLDTRLVDGLTGTTTNAQLKVEVDVSNKLDLNSIPRSVFAVYQHQFDVGTLQSSVFKYDIVEAEIEDGFPQAHDDLSIDIDEAGSNWVASGPEEGACIDVPVVGEVCYTASAPHVLIDTAETTVSLGAAGVNRPIPAFLAESYAIPVQECFVIPPIPLTPVIVPVPVCYIRERGDTDYRNLQISMDVFPDTLDAFFALSATADNNQQFQPAWGQSGDLRLAPMIDADGDGLPFTDDVDDANWDSDGDLIPDGTEFARGSNPRLDDGDGDGLLDWQEYVYRTAPMREDTDFDGLLDGKELVEGWSMTYGDGQETRMFSHPNYPDFDGDLILDSQESLYGFNPRLQNNRNFLAFETQLSEPDAPFALYRFDDSAETTAFKDSSAKASSRVASCTSCPFAGEDGVYNTGVLFNGTNDMLTVEGSPILDQSEIQRLGFSLWIKPDSVSGRQTLFSTASLPNNEESNDPAADDSSNPNFETGLEIVLNGDDLELAFEDGDSFALEDVIVVGEWQHVAVELEVTGQFNQASADLYHNNTRKSTFPTVALDLTAIASAESLLTIGATLDDNDAVVNAYAGRMDELALFDRTFSIEDVNDLRLGQYNVDDLLLKPGQKLEVNSSVSNGLGSRSISGIQTVDFDASLTSAEDQTVAFNLPPNGDQAFGALDEITVLPTAASGTYSITQAVDGRVDDPEGDEFDPNGNASLFSWSKTAEFSGSNSLEASNGSLNFNQLATSTGFTISAWVFPSGDNERRGVFGRYSGPDDNNATPYLETEGDDLYFGFGTSSNRVEAKVLGELDMFKWNFVAVAFQQGSNPRFFINDDSFTPSMTGSGMPLNTTQPLYIGRTNDQGLAVVERVELICEGDAGKNAEIDIVSGGVNIFERQGVEGTVWVDTPNAGGSPIAIQKTVQNAAFLTFCEDDDSEHNSCDIDEDEFLSLEIFSTNVLTHGTRTELVSSPPGYTNCSDAPTGTDVIEYDYRFENVSAPFIGDIQDIRIFPQAYTTANIGNVKSNNRLIAEFNFDDPPQANTFSDAVSFHQGSCDEGLNQCPIAGIEGRENSALLFDGSNDGVDVDTIPAEAANSPELVMAAWIKPESVTGKHVIMSFNDNAGVSNSIYIERLTATTYEVVYEDDNIRVPSTHVLTLDGEWHRVNFAYDQFGANLNVDEQFPNTIVNTTSKPAASDRFTIGYAQNSASGRHAHFHGAIDHAVIGKEFFLWGQSGTESDRDQVPRLRIGFNDATNGFEPGLKGQVGNTFDFNGGTDSLTADITPLANDGIDNVFQHSFGIWVKPDEFGQEQVLFNVKKVGINALNDRNEYTLSLDANGIPKLVNNQSQTLNGAGPLIPGVWNHIMATSEESGPNQTQLTLYVNAAEVDSTSGLFFADFNPHSVELLLGSSTTRVGTGPFVTTDHFNGQLDEFVLYRRALSPSEVKETYNFQLSWVGDKVVEQVTVAADAPTLELSLPTAYLPNTTSSIAISTTANEAAVTHASLTVDGDRTIPALQSPLSQELTAEFEPYRGEGSYLLNATAVNAVGLRGTIPTTVTVHVDGKAPLPTEFSAIGAANGAIPGLRLRGAANNGFDFVGKLVDPTLPNGQPGSGLPDTALSIRFISANDDEADATFETQYAEFNADGTFSLRYEVISDNPSGDYQFELTVKDNVGNTAVYELIAPVGVDATTPKTELTLISTSGAPTTGGSRSSAGLPAYLNGSSRIEGVASEAPVDTIQHDREAGIQAVQTAFEPLFEYGSPFVNEAVSAETLLLLPLDEGAIDAGDTNNSFADLAANLTATCTGTTCPAVGADGKIGTALSFDGVNDYLSLGHVPAINGLTNDFTIGAWVNSGESNGTQRILSTSRNNSTNGFGFGWRANNNGIFFTTYGRKDYVLTYPVQDNIWYHVAMTMDSNNDVTFYVNGIDIGTVTGTLPAAPDTDDALLIGSLDGAGGTGQYFDGIIDDVRVIDAALDSSEIVELMGLAPTLHLPFDEAFIGTGSGLEETSDLAATATVVNDGIVDSAENQSVPGVVGHGAIEFTEEQHRFTVSADEGVLPSDNDPFTMSWWFEDGDGLDFLLDTSTQSGIVRFTMGGSWLHVAMNGIVVNNNTFSSTSGWQHMTLVYGDTPNQLDIYQNGVPRQQIAFANGTGLSAGATQLRVNKHANRPGTPAIDDLRIYQRALQPLEIAALAQTGWQNASISATRGGTMVSTDFTASPPAGLEGFYKLQTRAVDTLNNHRADSSTDNLWTGMVDTLAPRAILTKTGNTYTFDVTDFSLNMESFSAPAACSGTPDVTNYESAWYAAFTSQNSDVAQTPYRAVFTCTLGSPLSPTATFTLCDVAGNCTVIQADGTLVPTAVGLNGVGAVSAETSTTTLLLLTTTLLTLLGFAFVQRRTELRRRRDS